MAQPSAALAAGGGRGSGGRVGGYGSASRTTVGATERPQGAHRRGSRSTVIVQSTPAFAFGFIPVMPFGFGGYGYGQASTGGSIVSLLLIVLLIGGAIAIFNNYSEQQAGLPAASHCTWP